MPRTGEPLARTFTPNPDGPAPVVDHRATGGGGELPQTGTSTTGGAAAAGGGLLALGAAVFLVRRQVLG